MKKISLIGVLLTILILPVASSHEEKVDPGVTPDSFLWGLDKALDNLNLLLTFNPTEKARKGIGIARERLEEIKLMAEENKLEAAEKGKEEQLKILSKVKKSVSDIKEENSTKQIEEEIEIERELEEHEEDIEEVSDNLKIKIEVKGALNERQKALLGSILSSLENKTSEVKVEIKNKKDKTKIEIKQKTGKSEIEIENEIEEIEKEKGLIELKKEKAMEEIEDAKEDLQELEEELQEHKSEGHVADEKPITTLMDNAKKRLANAEEAFAKDDFGEAFGQANAAQQLIENAERILEKIVEKFEEEEEDEQEIEVKIEDGKSKVKVEIGDEKLKFTLETTDKDAIIQEIAERTGLSIEEVTKLVEFVEEKEVRSVLRLGENVKAPNGYGAKFTGLPFAECPSGLPKEVIAEVSGVELTLLDQIGQPLRDTLGNEEKIIICKGDSKIVPMLGNIVIKVVNFRYAEYPSGAPEIPPTAEIILTTTVAEKEKEKLEEKEKEKETKLCKIGGCSGQLCGEASFIENVVTICLYKVEYECYKKYGKCEVQANGKCGWTQKEELLKCLEEKGKKEEKKVNVEDKESCEAQGGKWEIHGLSLEESCLLPTSDAGKKCLDSDECEGDCIAELSAEDKEKLSKDGIVYTKGKCSEWKRTYGCHAFVDDEKVMGILCKD